MELTRIPKPEHGSVEWLRVRHRDERGLARISASAAACIHGEHEYKSAADYAIELLADEPEETETTPAMERGNRLEPVLIDWAGAMIGKTLQTPQEMFSATEAGVRLIATLDAVAVNSDGNPEVYEVKTTRRRWDGTLPRYWYWQGVQQAICAGVDKITWIIFDSDLNLHFHEQTVTSDEKQVHITRARQFLGDIDMGQIPEDVNLSYDNVAKLHKDGPSGETTELDADIIVLLMRLETIDESMKELEATKSAVKAEIGQMLGNAEYGTYDGNLVVTWKRHKRTILDQRRFQSEHPALFEKFQKTSHSRIMRIVKKGEN